VAGAPISLLYPSSLFFKQWSFAQTHYGLWTEWALVTGNVHPVNMRCRHFWLAIVVVRSVFFLLSVFIPLSPSHSFSNPPPFFFSLVTSPRKSHSPEIPDHRLPLRPRSAPPPAPVSAGGQRKEDEECRCRAEKYAGAADLNKPRCRRSCRIMLVEC
jgi:hypothetical protein